MRSAAPHLRSTALAGIVLLIAFAALACPCVVAAAAPQEGVRGGSQGAPSNTRESLSASRNEALQKLGTLAESGRWRDAQRVAQDWLQGHPDDELMLYNLACTQSQLGDQRAAASSLRQAMHAGFAEWTQLESDADLAPLRSHEAWESVTALRATLAATPRTRRGSAAAGPSGRAERVVTDWKARHGETEYRYERDDVRRLIFVSSLDPTADAEMKAMIRTQADHLIEALFQQAQPDTVVLAIPTLEDAGKYLEVSESPGQATQGGVYDHGERALISRDIGASLRHEFTHALHWGHMDRLSQRHPIWIQEGLASLYESYDTTESGRVRFRPNERHNIAFDAVERGTVPSVDTLSRMGYDQFIEPSSVLVNYAIARSLFEHLASQRKVEDFYRAYTKSFERDPTGKAALEEVWGKPIETVESDWRRWLKRRGAVDDTVGEGDASLGITGVDAGDGIRVLDVAPGAPAERAGIRPGDVIVQVGTRVVRSQLEMQLDMARRRVGEKVDVRFRRGDSYSTLSVTLAPLGGRRHR